MPERAEANFLLIQVAIAGDNCASIQMVTLLSQDGQADAQHTEEPLEDLPFPDQAFLSVYVRHSSLRQTDQARQSLVFASREYKHALRIVRD
jgi:hypothetical protein